MRYLGKIRNIKKILSQRFCTRIVALAVCASFLAICCCGCQFPYKIDPSGNCLFVKNENATLPEYNSPFTTTQGLRPNEPAPAPVYQSSIPGVAASPGTAVASSTTGVVGGGTTRSTSTLLVPGSGPIVLVTPDEQIALVGSEVIFFANYKGDDDYLRTGERIEWSLGGVGHIQTTNKTQCGNVLALDFNKDKKVSDRFAVTSTLHYEGTIDRGSADEQGKVPHLAGQSWISIQSAEEGTSTVTAFAPTIKDWNRRTSNATVHWIDAEWIYPRNDITKYNDPKIFVTEVKKRSSGAPCPGWIVRYEVMSGGPNAGLGPNQSKVLEVPTGPDGKAAIELYLLEGNSGVSTIKATIIRPVGVDGGTKRLELHSTTVANHWSQEAPLKMTTQGPRTMSWGERTDWSINIENRSSVAKPGTVSLQLPSHLQLLSSTPQPTGKTQQPGGGELVSWSMDFPAQTPTQIRFVLQAETNDSALRSQPLDLDLSPELTMYPSREMGSGNSTGSSNSPSNSSPSTFAPPDNAGSSGQGSGGGLDYGNGQSPFPDGTGGDTTTPLAPAQQGSSDPTLFAKNLTCDIQTAGSVTAGKANEIIFRVTNNASTPFSKGVVQVELSDGLVFCNTSGTPIKDENNANMTFGYIYTDSTEKEISIQPGQTFQISFNVTPTKTGTLAIRASMISEQRQYIEGAEYKRTVVVSQ